MVDRPRIFGADAPDAVIVRSICRGYAMLPAMPMKRACKAT